MFKSRLFETPATAGPDVERRPLLEGLDRRALLGILTFAGIASLFPGRSSDQVVLGEYALRTGDPGLFPGDELVGRGVGLYPSLYPWLLAHFVHSDLVAGAVMVGVRAAFFASLYLLSFSLFRDRTSALLASAGGLFVKFALGGAELGEEYLIPRTLVLPLVVLALWLALEKRWSLSFLLLGATAILHLTTAVYYVPLLAAGLLVAAPRLETLRRLILPGILAAVAAAPILPWLLSLPRPSTPDLALLQLRAPHLFLQNTTPQEWANVLPFAGLLVAGLLLRRKEKSENDRMVAGWVLVSVAVMAGNFVSMGAGVLWPGEPYRVSLLLLLFGVLYGARWARRLWARPRLVVRASGIAIALLLVVWPHLRFGFYTERFLGGPADPVETDWQELQRWARTSTDRKDLFITPPERTGFRLGSERGIVGTLKDGIYPHYPDYFRAWWGRMQDLGVRAEGGRLVSGYAQMPEPQFTEVARKYGASYVVVEPPRALNNSSLAHQNAHFRAYRLAP